MARVDVVEISAEIIGWHGTHLRHLAAPAWEDGRVHVINADMVAWLARQRGPYDVICLDVNNGPEWTVWDANQVLYGDEGLRRIRDSLRPGGVISVWSAAEAPAFEDRLLRHFTSVHAHRVPVRRGQPDVVYLAKRGYAATCDHRRPGPGPRDRHQLRWHMAARSARHRLWPPHVRHHDRVLAGPPPRRAAQAPSRPGSPPGSADWTGWRRRP